MAEIKRLRYFNSQFLVEKDFNDEQAYHVEMRRRLNRSLHTWGVAEGLDVTASGQKEVRVSPGMAIDREGREIVLPADPPPAPVSLATFAANTDVLITIRYQEANDEADHYTVGGLDKYTRTTERPAVEAVASAPGDGSVVTLARVRLGATGAIASVDPTVRARVSSAISPDADLRARSLSVSGGQWDLANTEGDLRVGGATARLKVGIATGGSGAGDVRLRSHGGTNRLLLGSGTADVLTVQNGNVGIGAISPTATLDLRGSARFSGTLSFGDADGAGYPDGWIGMSNGVEGTTRWLHIGGITDSGARRLALYADRVYVPGRIGIGITNPIVPLHIPPQGIQWGASATAGENLHIVNDTLGGPRGLRFYSGNYGSGTHLLTVTTDARIGVGQLVPQSRIHVGTFTCINEGVTPGGAWANIGSNLHFDGAWKRIDNSKPGVNLHMNGADSDGMEFRFYRDPGGGQPAVNIGIIGSRKSAVLSPLAVGHDTPGHMLDVAGRVRFREGAGASAGIWLLNGGSDRAFIGMQDDNHVGFWGQNGAGWSLTVNTVNGNIDIPGGRQIFCPGRLHIFGEELLYLLNKSGVVIGKEWGGNGNLEVQGRLTVGGGKNAYVTDQFVNRLNETLEQGDVVVIGSNQSALFYGKDGSIPVLEADLTDRAYDTRVCGIVCDVHGQLEAAAPPAPDEEGAAADRADSKPKSSRRKKRGEDEAAPPETPQVIRAFSTEEAVEQGETKVGPGQVGYMVTLGAFSYCKVDADIAPIEVGDLLTTSPTRGHAQKVTDRAAAAGAIVGKALGSLKEGRGKIPVMVVLQ